MTALLAIGVGAVLGAWARYGLSLWMNGPGWMPWGTFFANAMGVLFDWLGDHLPVGQL